eukprot:scaffold4656_cov117-Isochrysis_galbana.AAC.9
MPIFVAHAGAAGSLQRKRGSGVEGSSSGRRQAPEKCGRGRARRLLRMSWFLLRSVRSPR